jgi:hypothetical protein
MTIFGIEAAILGDKAAIFDGEVAILGCETG